MLQAVSPSTSGSDTRGLCTSPLHCVSRSRCAAVSSLLSLGFQDEMCLPTALVPLSGATGNKLTPLPHHGPSDRGRPMPWLHKIVSPLQYLFLSLFISLTLTCCTGIRHQRELNKKTMFFEWTSKTKRALKIILRGRLGG